MSTRNIDLNKASLRRGFFIFLAGYFLLHIIFRVLISNSLTIDEAEMVIYSQQPFWLGYNSQPPLYSWIQVIFFNLFGLNIFSLVVLKNLLIFFIYFFLYKSAKEILRNELYAILSSVSLFLVYNFSWRMHKDLTHTVLLTAISAITFYLFLKILSSRALKYYLLLGVVIGLGVLSKYNYVIFLVAPFLSAVSMKTYRKALLNKRMLIAVIIALVLIAPHLYWCATHWQLVVIDKAKLKMAGENGLVPGFKGILSLVEKIAIFMSALFFVYISLFPEGFKRLRSLNRQDNNIRHWLERFFIFFFLIMVLIIIIYRITATDARWVLSILFLSPLYFFIRLKSYSISGIRAKIFIGLVLICAISTLFSLSGRVLFASSLGKFTRLNYPYGELSAMIKKGGFQKGLILAENYVIGADLKFSFKDSYVVTPEPKMDFGLPQDFDSVLVVWDNEGHEGIAPLPDELKNILSKLNLDFANRKPIIQEALYKYSKDKYYKIQTLVLRKNKERT